MSDNTDKLANARSQAMAQYESISEMVAKLNASRHYDAFEAMAKELATEAGFKIGEHTDEDGETVYFWHNRVEPAQFHEDEDDSYGDEDEAWLACCEDNGLRPDEDETRRAIEEDALSVEIRSGWYTPGGDSDPEEFRILLCTGGPAVQIRGELDGNREPSRAWLECQDWFTPWTQVFGDGTNPNDPGAFRRTVDSDVLLAYAQTFYFGE